jgi:hypothetical protein
MKAKLQHIIHKPFFLLLLPVFFFLHTLLANYYSLLVDDAIKFTLIYTAAGLLIALLLWLWYRDFHKASLAAFVLLAINFFFGSAYQFIQQLPGGNFLSRYRVLLPVLGVFIIASLIFIKRSRRKFLRTGMYLNILFLLLITLDCVQLISGAQQMRGHYIKKINLQLNPALVTNKPDIFLLVADEYAGKQQLQDIFRFDNSAFEATLKERGLTIIDSSIANYNSTIYSIASMFSLDYIDQQPEGRPENYKDILFCRDLIKRNSFTRFLVNSGYRICNYSFVDIGKENKATENILPPNPVILNGSTLLYRLLYTFGASFTPQKKLDEIKTKLLFDNIKIDSLLRKLLTEKRNQPKFVYAHFNMPHWPYFFDSSGNSTPLSKLTEEFKADKKAYIQYLHYTNHKLLQYIDLIKKHSPNPPVIILMSDHGFRQLPPGTEKKYYFMNLNAVYLPSGDYSGFYKGMSNVNQFRTILHKVFNQHIVPLKDTSLFIKDY